MSRRHPNLSDDQRQELAVSYAACRGPIRHRWDIIPSSPYQRPLMGTLLLLRCDNCGTERHDVFSRHTGRLMYRRYDHPDGYSDVLPMTGDERRMLFAAIVTRNQPELLADAEVKKVVDIRRRRRTG